MLHTTEGVRVRIPNHLLGVILGQTLARSEKKCVQAYEDDFGRVFQADRICQACLLNGQAKIGKQDDQEEFRVRGHLRANPPVVFIPAEVNGQR